MDIILLLLFVAVLLFFFSSSVRAWVLSRIMQSVQKRFMQQMERQAREQAHRAQSGFGGQGHSRNAYSEEGQRAESYERGSTTRSQYGGKLDMDDIATKKFDKAHREDYVDFEELPK